MKSVALKLFNIIGLLAAPHFALANVSLLQETREIECAVDAKNFDRVVIDPKDTKITLSNGKDVVREYERVKFLDSAILAKASNGSFVLFQVLLSGDNWLTEGDLIPFVEKNCDDTGASKTCKNDVIKKLFWSPEKLSLATAKWNLNGAVETYGFLANHATFFRARDKKGMGVTLIDSGSNVELVVGSTLQAKCKYN